MNASHGPRALPARTLPTGDVHARTPPTGSVHLTVCLALLCIRFRRRTPTPSCAFPPWPRPFARTLSLCRHPNAPLTVRGARFGSSRTFEEVAKHGKDGFYRGRIAEAIIEVLHGCVAPLFR